jgi:predicted RNA-binding protein with RPS1 domain
LKKGGAVDPDGHPTSFGRELNRFSALGSASAAVAIMYADRLSCVPEVMTILALLYEKALTGTRGLLLDRADWPDEWRFEAAERHRALASACEDEAELVLQVCAGWERSDVTAPPWSSSGARGDWARRWWVNDEVLRAAAESRREVLTALSPAMKEEVKRFVEPALVRRARGVIARAMAGLEHRREGDLFRPITAPPNGEGLAVLESSCLAGTPSDRVIPLFRRNPTVDDFHRISNLVAVEPWATEGLGGDVVPTSPEDAMRLLTLSSAHARPDTSKDVLGATMESWPAGLRALMTFAPVDGRLRVTELRQLCPPFPAPRAEADSDPAEGIAPQGTDVSEVETAVEADAAPELDTAWPARNSAIPDDEVLAKRAVLDSREVEAAEAACGVCRWCLAGMPEECATPSTGEDGPTVDLLEAWRQRATLRVDVSTPLVDSGDGALSDGWYEVVGYRITLTGEPVVVLRHDWRPPGDPRGPAVHPDLRPGEPVELVVGPTVRDHRDELLMFERADGLGRFLLREAPTSARRQDENGQIAVSLHRQYQGLLARLKLHKGATVVATAIPRKETGCYTVTFLDLLRQHLDASSEGHVEKFEVETKKGRMAVPFYPAVVTREANSRGYVEAQLLARDSTIGLVHGASFLTGESVGVEEPDKGTGILLRLSPATAVLSLRGVPLDPIRPIVDREPSLDLPLPDTDPYEEPDETTLEDAESSEAGLLALDKDEENTVGGVTSVLFARRPVPKYVARELCTVADAPAWSSSVWRFWAQSRHLNTNRAEPYRTGAPATDSIEFSAELREEASPPPRLSLEEAQERYPVGTTVDATVTGIGNGGARAWLRLPDGTKGTIVKGAAGSRGIADLREVLAVEAVVSAQVREVNYFKDAIQVELTMRDLVVPGSGLSLEEAQECYPAGTTVDATVTGFTRAQDRVFLALEDGTEAMVLKGDVGRGLVVRLSAVLARGDRLSGVVKAVSEHEGKPQVRMRLPSVNAPPLAAQLQECGLSVGSEVPGTVKNVVEYGLFVQVAEGVDNGLVHVSTLPGRSVLGFDVGTVVRVEILSAAENPKRAGAISLGLRYIGRV